MEGLFYDPLHGGCLRQIVKKNSSDYVIQGVYGDDEPPHFPGEPWLASIRKSHNFLSVDFLSKTVNHPRKYSALYCPSTREIRWEDGNVWKQLYW